MHCLQASTLALIFLTFTSHLLVVAPDSQTEITYYAADCAQNDYWNNLEIGLRNFCQNKGWTEDSWEEGWDWEDLSTTRQLYWSSKNVTRDDWESKHRHWEILSTERQNYYVINGINKDIWEQQYVSQDDWERKYLDWDQLLTDRRKYYVDKGITRDDWEQENLWEDLTLEQREFYAKLGWNEEAWIKNDKSLLSLYNEEELDWNDLTEDRKIYWLSNGLDEYNWGSKDDDIDLDEVSIQHVSETLDFQPLVIKLPIPELELLNMDYLAGIDTEIGLKDGETLNDNESFYGPEMTLKNFMRDMRQDSTKLYFQLEDLDHYKEEFQASLGDKITHHLYNALAKTDLRERGILRDEWQINNTSSNSPLFDWSLFVGGSNTTTAMHYDTDLFNFLWVVEGRKRVVMIPNNERTQGRYSLVSAYSGSGWTGEDILNSDYQLPTDAVVVELGAQEGLVLPYLCWHAVRNLEPTVAYGLRVKED